MGWSRWIQYMQKSSDFITSVDLISGSHQLLSVMSVFLPDQIGWSRWIQYMQKGSDFITSVDLISRLHQLWSVMSVFLPDQIGWSRWIQYMQKGSDFITKVDLKSSGIETSFRSSRADRIYTKGLWFYNKCWPDQWIASVIIGYIGIFTWSDWMIKMNPVYAKGLWF